MGNYLFSTSSSQQETSTRILDEERYEQTDDEYTIRLYKFECKVYESTNYTLSTIVKELTDVSRIRDVVESLNVMMYTAIYEAKDILYLTPPENDNELFGVYLDRLDSLRDRELNRSWGVFDFYTI